MKQQLKTALFAVPLALISLVALAQQEEIFTPTQVIPKWVSKKGFWVVEGNIHNRQERILHFYNNNDQRVYKETVTGKFNLRKRKTLMRMKRTLDAVVTAWEQKKPINEPFFAAAKWK